ncbi:transcription cofactor vestigial-like protein 1 isoform X1 [Ornithorhynchus anatinus]|nr:transcription cofactor vestigial-like protein 1 isoform X1 [Ornithorhynchus anatinus]XP_028922937.1 transcription cofactor vestigial-like protein 1 isoform X1 [Ornithorhynchus anatinus]
MEGVKKDSIRLNKNKQQPIKTEWNSQCVLFTYFQGDINSVVDEHFSRALSNTKAPQDLSTKCRREDGILKNDNHMSSSQWNFSSQWTKPQQVSPVNSLAGCGLNLPAAAATAAMDHYPVPVMRNQPDHPGDLWHFQSMGNPSSSGPRYPLPFPELHMAQGPASEGKYGSLLSLLQQERCLGCSQESEMKQEPGSSCSTGTARLASVTQNPDGGKSPESASCDLANGSWYLNLQS